jgi:CheY-like chemotaxis protein/transcriptional regulator with XRE-family HTH domain
MRDDVGQAASQPQHWPIRRTDETGQFLPERTNRHIGLQIRTARRLIGWSRAATAEQLGLDVQTFAGYENGSREITSVTLARIADLMHRPIGWFCDRPAPVVARRRDLPATLVPQATTSATGPGPAAASDNRPVVLLVDDSPDVLVTLGAFLEGAGLQVVKARSGDEALRIVASDTVLHAIVTDNAMPGLSGAELLLQSAQLRPTLPGLIVTGFADSSNLGDLPSTVGVLCKPFRREDLVRRVQELTQPTQAVSRRAVNAGRLTH